MTDVESAAPIRVCLSYRRSDSGHTGWLCDALADEFGKENVFRDRTGIRAAHDFTVEIANALEKANVVVAVVGHEWLRGGVLGRLRRQEDWVFRELEFARGHRKHVLPVLLNGAKMPGRRSLPPALRFFARLNAVPLRDESWDADVREIVRTVRELAKLPPPETADPLKAGARRSASRGWIAGAALATLAILTWALWPKPEPRPEPEPRMGAGPAIQPYVNISTVEDGDTVPKQTGVLVSTAGHVLTIMGDPPAATDTIVIRTSDGRFHPASVVRHQPNPDTATLNTTLVLFRIERADATPALRISEILPQPREEIVIWGMRREKPDPQAFSGQVDSAANGIIHYRRLETQGFGLMGAPMIDRANGEMVGLHVGSRMAENRTEAFGYGSQALRIRDFLRQAGVPAEAAPTDPPS
jgi:hypothetical protein